MKTSPRRAAHHDRGERGAALITALLMTVLLLTAGGALILTTGMAVSTAADSTAEMQAYYAAEAGLESALAILRGNVAATNPASATSKFRTVVCGTADPCNNTGATFSQWLAYPASGVITLSASPATGYSLTVRDASLAPGAALPPSPYSPRYLIVTSTGYGPKGARKVLEMTVDDYLFDFTARSAVAVRSNDLDLTGMAKLDLGTSNPHLWNGNDHATPPGPSLPAFTVTNTADYDAGDGFGLPTATPPNLQGTAEKAIGADEANILGPQQLVKLSPSSLEAYLQTADNARAFLNQMKAKAADLGRLNPNDIGTEATPKFTFIDGDLDLSGGDHGAGLLIVTGTITQGGSSSFKGIVMALGEGKLVRNGTPDALGALVVAKFQHITDPTTGLITGSGGFLSPYIDSAGGGNSLVGYDSEWVRKALDLGGGRVRGVVEK